MKAYSKLLLFIICFLFIAQHTLIPETQLTPPPLFTAYPELAKHIPYVPLGNFPTPLHNAEKLAAHLGIKELFIKQDNLSGKPLSNNQQLPGGNKVRKLEILLADAITRNFDTVLTVGPTGSNHVATTAMYAKELGLKSIIMLTPQLPTSYAQRNLLLDLYAGADIHFYQSNAQRTIAITKLAREYNEKGIKLPYYIPMGGSCEIGCIGFVNAIFELKEQIKKGLMKEPDYIYVPLGSAGTAAGIILGAMAGQFKCKIIPVQVYFTAKYKTNHLIELINQTSAYLHSFDPSFPLITAEEKDLLVNDNFAGEKYAQITPEAAKAIELLQKHENIKLDGTYAGKAFAALINEALQGKFKDKTVLFWNTYSSGNYENFTSQVNYKNLPQELQYYFTTTLQTLDQGC